MEGAVSMLQCDPEERHLTCEGPRISLSQGAWRSFVGAGGWGVQPSEGVKPRPLYPGERGEAVSAGVHCTGLALLRASLCVFSS